MTIVLNIYQQFLSSKSWHQDLKARLCKIYLYSVQLEVKLLKRLMSRWQWQLDASSTYIDMLNDQEHESCKGYLWSSRSMIKKAWNFQRYSLFNILLRCSESFAHSLIYHEIIDDFYYWLVLGDIITWVHLCVAMVTTLPYYIPPTTT